MVLVELSIKIWQKGGEFVDSCHELDVFCYGQDYNQARNRLKKVIVFYAETASQLGYEIDTKDILESLNTPITSTSNVFIN